MPSPFDSEEAYWAHQGPGQDQTPGILQNQQQMDVSQSRDLANSELESKRNVGDIVGEAPTNALKMYWKGSEEARAGEQHQTAQQEAQQRMEFAKSAEGRAAGRYGAETEERDYQKGRRGVHERLDEQGLTRGDLGIKSDRLGLSAAQSEEDWANASDTPGGPTHRAQAHAAALKHGGLENDYLAAQIRREGAAAADGATSRVEQRFLEDADALQYAPDPQKAADELMNDPTYAKIPLGRRQRLAQAAVTKGGAQRTTAQNQADMTWEITGGGGRFQKARDAMDHTAVLADELASKGQVHAQYSYLNGNLEPEESRTARGEAAQILREMGDWTGAKEIEGTIAPGTSVQSVINRVAARKLEESANAVEGTIRSLPPADQQRANVAAARARAAEMRAHAKQLRSAAGTPARSSLIKTDAEPGGAPAAPAARAGIQGAAAQPGAAPDALGLFPEPARGRH